MLLGVALPGGHGRLDRAEDLLAQDEVGGERLLQWSS